MIQQPGDAVHHLLRLQFRVLGGLPQQGDGDLGIRAEPADAGHRRITNVWVLVLQKGFHQGRQHDLRVRPDTSQGKRRGDADAGVRLAAHFLDQDRDSGLGCGADVAQRQRRLKAGTAVRLLVLLKDLYELPDGGLGQRSRFGQGLGGAGAHADVAIPQGRRQGRDGFPSQRFVRRSELGRGKALRGVASTFPRTLG
jgi:hypothetical protein